MFKQAVELTREEIRAMCLEIQEDWTAKERRNRMVDDRDRRLLGPVVLQPTRLGTDESE